MGRSREEMARLREKQGPRVADVHLYRGSPVVRSWSRYKSTDRAWSLCGSTPPTHATTDPNRVTCEFCLQLLAPEWRRPSPLKAAAPQI